MTEEQMPYEGEPEDVPRHMDGVQDDLEDVGDDDDAA